MDRQSLLPLPSLHGPQAAIEIRGDFLPRPKAAVSGWNVGECRGTFGYCQSTMRNRTTSIASIRMPSQVQQGINSLLRADWVSVGRNANRVFKEFLRRAISRGAATWEYRGRRRRVIRSVTRQIADLSGPRARTIP